MDNAPYTPQQIANFFLDEADKEGIPVSPLKLIKLVYIAYGWVLALTGKKLFDEPIEAWKHGPVIDSLYHEFKVYRSGPISGRATDFDLDTFDEFVPSIPEGDAMMRGILHKVWSAYKRFSAWSLRQKTHEIGGPWHKVYHDGMMGVTLNDEDIREHYKNRISQYLKASHG